MPLWPHQAPSYRRPGGDRGMAGGGRGTDTFLKAPEHKLYVRDPGYDSSRKI